MTAADVQRLETERLRPTPHDPDPLDELFRQLLDLITAEAPPSRAMRISRDTARQYEHARKQEAP